MTQFKMNLFIAAATYIATVGLASSAWAQGDATCYRWDEEEKMRCFDCLRPALTVHGWRLVNTCPPRSVVILERHAGSW